MSKIETLFSDLVRLTETSEAFYKQEFKLDDSIYWIFNYRLASYSDFQLPSAKWARGTMFEVDSNGKMIRLASLPMPKFFNLHEMSPDRLSILGEQLVKQGRLSKHVYERAKEQYDKIFIEK
ncbi:MAG TPA: hypothetical protein VFM18_03290 [Methanosarcina sp.]|nr:hypothetical protein [Methanosarcina sp.]